MTTRDTPFGDRPFLLADGCAAGFGRAALSGPRFDRPFHGVRRSRAPQERAADDGRWPVSGFERVRRELRELCEAYATRMTDGQFFSHDTALVLVGAPMPRHWSAVVHVAVHRPRQAPAVRGIVGHRLQEREARPWHVGPLVVEEPVRAWVQASRLWPTDDLIAAGDYLVSPRRRLASIDELAAESARMRGRVLDDVVAQLRVGSESAEETRLRLCLVRAGLPGPELAVELRRPDGAFVARLDQAYRRFRVAVEYDGRQHAEDPGQFARDADRWAAIRDADWDLVRILRHHLADGAGAAVAKVRTALLRAGWRPGAPDR